MTRHTKPTMLIMAMILAVTIAFLGDAAPLSFPGRIFPTIIGAFLVVLIVAQLLSDGVRLRRQARAGTPEPATGGDDAPASVRDHLIVLAWVLGFLVAVALLGATISMPLFLIVFLWMHGESLIVALLLCGLILAFILGVLGYLLHIRLPEGILIGLF